MKEERYIEILEFLDGKLNEAKAQEFRNAIATDEQLAEDVAFVRLEREMMNALLDDDMTRKMKAWQKEKNTLPDEPDDGTPPGNSPPGKTGGNRQWLLLLLPLLVAGVWWFMKPAEIGEQTAPLKEVQKSAPATTEQPQEPVPPASKSSPSPAEKPESPVPSSQNQPNIPIAQKSPTDAELLAMVETNDFMPADYFPHSTRGVADDLAKAEKARKEGNYAKATELYDQVAKTSSNLSLEAAWNLGLLYFKQKKFREALPHFEKVAANDNFLYQDDARYLTVLCQLATRQFRKAETTLNNLIEKEYFDDAEKREKAMRLKQKVAKMN